MSAADAGHILAPPNGLASAEQIAAHLRRLLRDGRLQPGARLPAERDLARLFRVSLTTVNKAMATLERDRLLERAPRRGTFVRADACRGTVAVVFHIDPVSGFTGGPFFRTLVHRLGERLGMAGFRPHHCLSHGGDDAAVLASIQPESALWNEVAAVVTHGPSALFQEAFGRRGIPVVALGEAPAARLRVYNDHDELARLAVRHLAERGCRRIGGLFREAWTEETASVVGFRAALADLGRPCEPGLCACGLDWARGGYSGMETLWHGNPRPDGLFMADDNLALGAGEFLVDRGVRTPQQLKIVTHATAGVPMPFALDFTRCQFDLEAFCGAIATLVEKGVANPRASADVRLTPTLVRGQTT